MQAELTATSRQDHAQAAERSWLAGNLSIMSSKKTKVDVLSESDFRMCYFFRRMNQRHAVLLKDHVVLDPKTGREMKIDDPVQEPSDAPQIDSEGLIKVKDEPTDDVIMPPPMDPAPTEHDAGAASFAEEKDVKPEIRVKYNGFSIFGKLLVVVVEPSRPEMQRVPHLFDSEDLGEDGPRQLSATPTPGRSAREDSVASNRRSATPAGRVSPGPSSSKRRRTSSSSAAPTGRADGRAGSRASTSESRSSYMAGMPLFRGGTPSDAGSSTPRPRRGDSVMSFGTPGFASAGQERSDSASGRRASSSYSQRYSRASGAPSMSIGLDGDDGGYEDRRGGSLSLREQSIALSDIEGDIDLAQRRSTSRAFSEARSTVGGDEEDREGSAHQGDVQVGDGDDDEEEDDETWWRQTLREESEAFGLASQMLQREEDATEGDARGIGEDE